MRSLTKFLMTLGFMIALPVSAHATDDFGSRFGGTAPPALSGPEVQPQPVEAAADTQALQDIAPAAGEPTGNITEESNAAPTETQETESPEIIPPKAPASTHDGYERDFENQNP